MKTKFRFVPGPIYHIILTMETEEDCEEVQDALNIEHFFEHLSHPDDASLKNFLLSKKYLFDYPKFTTERPRLKIGDRVDIRIFPPNEKETADFIEAHAKSKLAPS